MRRPVFLALLCLLHFAPAVLADRQATIVDNSGTRLSGSLIEMEGCGGLVFAPSTGVQARALGPQRLEVSWKAGRSAIKFELRYECGRMSFDQLAEDAGFRRTASGWIPIDGQTASPIEVLRTADWSGIARSTLQGAVCRSVVGQTNSRDVVFFAQFCVPELEYRRYSRFIDSVEKRIVSAKRES